MTKRRHLLGLVCATAVVGSLLGPAQALAGGFMVATPSSLAFGNVGVGSSLALNVQLTNTGPNLISNDFIDGANAAEFATNSACDGQSPTNASPCTIQVTFSPTSAAPKTATLHVPNNGNTPDFQVPLSGIGVLPLVPTTLAENPACAVLRAKLKKAKKKRAKRRIRRQLRNLGC